MILTPWGYYEPDKSAKPQALYFFKPESFRKNTGKRVLYRGKRGWLFETFDFDGKCTARSFESDHARWKRERGKERKAAR